MRKYEEQAVLLVIDYMVLDVKNWLPEHPGGDMIIPAQSLNKDASTHFELCPFEQGIILISQALLCRRNL